MLRGLHTGEGAFTLVELLVGMVLLLVLGTLATMALLDGYASERRVATSQQATADSVTLLQTLGNDLRAMSLRETSIVVREYDLPELRDRVLLEGGLGDLRVAQGDTIEFVADVMGAEAFDRAPSSGTAAGPECVRYQWAPATGLTRSIRSFNVNAFTCGALLATDRLLPPAPPRLRTGRATPVFTYRVRVNTNPARDPLNPADCVAFPATNTVPAAQLPWVVAVDLDLDALIGSATNAGSNELNSSVAFRTRLSHDYQYALGCSY